MSLVISEQQRKFNPVPAGTHLAVCTAVVEMGIQPSSRFDPREQVYIRWELPDVKTTWKDKKGTEHTGPMTIGKTYTKSLNEKATLRRDVESWRGKTFSKAELRAFDVTALLGQACMLGIVHRQEGDETYANIATVMGAPQGARPKPSAKLLSFDIDEWDPEAFEMLPGWLQEKIKGRVEKPKAEPPAAEPQEAEQLEAVPAKAEFDDDVPF